MAIANFRWLAAGALLFCCLAGGAWAEDWPCWRGPRGDGSSAEKNVPTAWDGETGQNIVWKVAIPGTGHSSPIVSGERIILVTCLTEGDQPQRLLMCLDRASGRTLWQTPVVSAPLEKKHNLNSYASGTPATDGRLIYCSFLQPDFGSQKERTPGDLVVAAYDFDGRQKWLVRPGRFASVHGFCSSPVLWENLVIVNGDHDGDAYIVALDSQTGQTVWKIDRPNKTRSYVTPIIRNFGGRTQMILSGSKCVASYDPRTGEQHWIIDGPTEQFVASIVDNGKLLFMTCGFPERHMLAIDPTGQGNVTDTHVRWRTTKAASYVPSPIAIGDYFLVVSDTGVATCFQAESGKPMWVERLGPHFSASLISAGGLAYFLADDGTTTIVRPGETLDVVATNKLGEFCFASPAVSDGRIYLRSEKSLYCIGSVAAE
ncbi:MAG: PQQ-like beta-propeller repeat protein [Planctomycetales bacterium]|nr:PQQ-like beta-propeller repeat protein [Planctomycetales bacterium]